MHGSIRLPLTPPAYEAHFEYVVLFVSNTRFDLFDLIEDSIQCINEAVELLFDSLSVGSTIKVPCTGKESVGAWKP